MQDINSLRWFKPMKLNRYPHFNDSDKQIWDSFLASESVRFFRFSYDVPLIEESLSGPNHPDYLSSDWNYLTAYKVDVIGDSLTVLHLFEVKPVLSHQAIGQIQSYRTMFPNKYYGYRSLISNIVCLSGPAPLYQVCDSLQINVYTVV